VEVQAVANGPAPSTFVPASPMPDNEDLSVPTFIRRQAD